MDNELPPGFVLDPMPEEAQAEGSALPPGFVMDPVTTIEPVDKFAPTSSEPQKTVFLKDKDLVVGYPESMTDEEAQALVNEQFYSIPIKTPGFIGDQAGVSRRGAPGAEPVEVDPANMTDGAGLAYGVQRAMSAAYEKPAWAVTELALRGLNGLYKYAGTVTEDLGLARGMKDAQPGFLAKAADYFSKPEEYGFFTEPAERKRAEYRQGAYQRNYVIGIAGDIAESVTDFIGFILPLSATQKAEAASGAARLATDPNVLAEFAKSSAKLSTYGFLTTSGKLSDRAKAGVFLIGYNMTPYLANATGAVGLNAVAVNSMLNTFLATPTYARALNAADGVNREFLALVIPQFVMDVGFSWNVRGLPDNQRKAALEQYLKNRVKDLRLPKTEARELVVELSKTLNDPKSTKPSAKAEALLKKAGESLAQEAPAGREGEADANDPAKARPEGSVSRKSYEENRKLATKPKSGGDFVGDIANTADRVLVPISTRLGAINPKLKTKMRRFEFDLKTAILKDEKAVRPFLETVSKMTREDRADLDLALKNGDATVRDAVVKKYGVEKEYAAVQKALGALYDRAKKVGMKIGYLEDYHPRVVNDVDGLLDHFQRSEHWDAITEAIHRRELETGEILTNEDRAEIINTLLRGYSSSQIKLARPGNAKERGLEEITPELNRFYMDSSAALMSYVYRVNDAIEARKFFGKTDGQASDGHIKDSVGALVLDLVQKGEIGGERARELSEILTARFNQRGTTGFWHAAKNVTYIETMGSPISAVTQIGDLAFSLYKTGFYRTGKALGESLVGRSRVTREDLGLERIAEEFADRTRSSRAVSAVFKAVGLEWMDRMGKQTFVNASFEKYQGLARAGKPEFVESMKEIFGEEAPDVVADLKAGETSENVKYLLFSDLADVQPIALSEMPQQYLESGNGRVFYMLKSYTLKQFDVYRNEVFDVMRQDPLKGMGNLVRLTSALVAMNASADVIKAVLLNRPLDPSTIFWDNIVRLTGFSKYAIYKGRDDGFGAMVGAQILPPFRLVDSVMKDAQKAMDANLDISKAETIQSIPGGGKFWYWWVGGGTEKRGRRRKKKF